MWFVADNLKIFKLEAIDVFNLPFEDELGEWSGFSLYLWRCDGRGGDWGCDVRRVWIWWEREWVGVINGKGAWVRWVPVEGVGEGNVYEGGKEVWVCEGWEGSVGGRGVWCNKRSSRSGVCWSVVASHTEWIHRLTCSSSGSTWLRYTWASPSVWTKSPGWQSREDGNRSKETQMRWLTRWIKECRYSVYYLTI